MKDIVIKAATIKRELIIFAVCWLVCELVNVYAIATMDGQWSETFLSMGFVTVAAAVVYVVLWVLRILVYMVSALCRRSRNNEKAK